LRPHFRVSWLATSAGVHRRQVPGDAPYLGILFSDNFGKGSSAFQGCGLLPGSRTSISGQKLEEVGPFILKQNGRDTWEECVLLRERVLALEPDLVILQICLNDHVRLPDPYPHSPYGAFGERPRYSYSSLLRLLDNRVEGFREWHVVSLKKLHIDHRTGRK
jgi:hypothetical protein